MGRRVGLVAYEEARETRLVFCNARWVESLWLSSGAGLGTVFSSAACPPGPTAHNTAITASKAFLACSGKERT